MNKDLQVSTGGLLNPIFSDRIYCRGSMWKIESKPRDCYNRSSTIKQAVK